MEKFARLLNPYEVVAEPPGELVAPQGVRARLLFRTMVEGSCFHYWSPGVPMVTSGLRYLIGMAVTWSLVDLHFADILNEALAKQNGAGAQVDVFDVEDAESWEALDRYFPNTDLGKPGWHAHPIVGRWEKGQLCR